MLWFKLLLILWIPLIESSQEIPDRIAHLLKQLNRQSTGTKDVLIYKFRNFEFDNEINDITNELVAKIPKGNPVTISELSKPLTKPRAGSINIVVSVNKYDSPSLAFLQKQKKWNPSSKYIWISLDASYLDERFMQISNKLKKFGILDMIGMSKEGHIYTYNPFSMDLSIRTAKNIQISEVFPDKLRDMNGYKYQINACDLPSRLNKQGEKLYGIDAFILDLMLEYQNATYEIKEYMSYDDLNFSQRHYMNFLQSSDADLLISAGPLDNDPTMIQTLTYNPHKLCAMVSNSHIKVERELVLSGSMKPRLWFGLLGVFIPLCSMWKFIQVKKLSRSPNTAADAAFAVFGFYVLQPVRLRKLCLLQRTLIQIAGTGLFLVGILFSSRMFAFNIKMENSVYMINRFEDLKYNQNEIFIHENFITIIENSNFSAEFMEKVKPFGSFGKVMQAIINEIPIVYGCEALKFYMMPRNGRPSLENRFYVIEEKMDLNFEYMKNKKTSPFARRLGYFYSVAFEAGLEQHYNAVLNEEPKPKPQGKSLGERISMVKFEDLNIAIVVYLLMSLTAILAFIGELLVFRIKRRFSKK